MSDHSSRTATSHVALGLAYVCAAVLALLPFHALLTTWLGSYFGHLDLFRIWKELIIVACIPPGMYIITKSPSYKKWLYQAWLPRLIIIYTLLTLIFGVAALSLHHVSSSALIYGLLANLRFLGFFLLVALVAARTRLLQDNWFKIVMMPAAFVIVFGLLQRLVLPYNFLRHFGYGPRTIPAYQTVDNKIDFRRIQSTLRGANPLGAYMVVIFGVLIARHKRRPGLVGVALLGTLIVLFLSYSRSAYLGAVLTGAIIVLYSIKSVQLRKRLALVFVGFIIIVLSAIGLLHHNQLVENTFFHTSSASHSATSSNAVRAKALESGVHDVLHNPIGRGPGTAGPESTRNTYGARISENYFLQLGQEVGWLGLGLFIAINALIGRELWRRHNDPLALALLGSLIGITAINMLSHAWADDTLGLLWWGLAGIALSPAILDVKHKPHEVTKKTN